MSRLHLTFACGDYDRTRALEDGSVRPDGIDASSGVERAPGLKDRARVRALISAVHGMEA